jgi:hypothetical protein
MDKQTVGHLSIYYQIMIDIKYMSSFVDHETLLN